MNKCSAIITARIKSSRIRRKVLQPLCGKTLLERIVDRLRMSESVDDILCAVSSDPGDADITDLCMKMNVKIFRGPTEDVLSRFLYATDFVRHDRIIRITGDLPFLSFEGIDALSEALTEQYDYANNCDVPNPWLDGTSCEIMWRDTIKRLSRLTPASMRSHVSVFARYGDFKTISVPSPVDISDVSYLNVLIDEPYQLESAKFIQNWINESGDHTYEGLCLFIMEHAKELEAIWCR